MKNAMLMFALMLSFGLAAAEQPTQMEETMYIVGLYDGCNAASLVNHKAQPITEYVVNDITGRCRGLVISTPAYKKLPNSRRDTMDILLDNIRKDLIRRFVQ